MKGTRNWGIIINPHKDKSFEVWADADYSGNWMKKTSELDLNTAKSRPG